MGDHIPDPTKNVKMTPAERDMLNILLGRLDVVQWTVANLDTFTRPHDKEAASFIRNAIAPLASAEGVILKRLEADRG